MFFSDPGSFVGGKLEKESTGRESQCVETWLEFAWVTDRVLGRRRGMGPDVRINGELGRRKVRDKSYLSYHNSLDGLEWGQS
jgi:hypothetical protein